MPRLGVIRQVERQVTLANGCPSLLICGRRRMGKSTLIRNLDAFVPDTVRIANVSMQNPKSFSACRCCSARLIDEKLRTALNDGLRQRSKARISADCSNVWAAPIPG